MLAAAAVVVLVFAARKPGEPDEVAEAPAPEPVAAAPQAAPEPVLAPKADRN